jgi:aminoglycoside phosphotransferase family enzyme/predicted kinase
MADDQADVVAFLSAPASYGAGVDAVERHETHGSIVFLAGAFAYKLKRAIKHPYLDYSTLALRKAMCERELEINRRTAPQLYLDVRPIVRRPDGALYWGLAGDVNDVRDWVVVMRRFEQAALLGNLCGTGALTVSMARALGEVIAEFHKRAERIPESNGAAKIAAVLDENASILASSDVIDRGLAFRLDQEARKALARVSALLDDRAAHGFVRRCHGDLHLDNICMIDGAPVLIDAIEFNEDFTSIDVLYDLAFALMELERRGLRAQANALLNRYLERTLDYRGLGALPLFQSCRAAIRAHVALARAAVEDKVRKSRDIAEARALLGHAVDLVEPRKPRLVAIGGVSGTGKSTLAYTLAPRVGPPPGAIVIRSDVTRKALAGVPEATRLPASAYTPKMHARVFAAMAERAEAALRGGYSVIADGVYGDAAERARLACLADAEQVPFGGLWLSAPRAVLEERVASRRGDASDATAEVLDRQLASVSPPEDWIMLDASGSPERLRDRAIEVLGLEARPLTESG